MHEEYQTLKGAEPDQERALVANWNAAVFRAGDCQIVEGLTRARILEDARKEAETNNGAVSKLLAPDITLHSGFSSEKLKSVIDAWMFGDRCLLAALHDEDMYLQEKEIDVKTLRQVELLTQPTFNECATFGNCHWGCIQYCISGHKTFLGAQVSDLLRLAQTEPGETLAPAPGDDAQLPCMQDLVSTLLNNPLDEVMKMSSFFYATTKPGDAIHIPATSLWFEFVVEPTQILQFNVIHSSEMIRLTPHYFADLRSIAGSTELEELGRIDFGKEVADRIRLFGEMEIDLENTMVTDEEATDPEGGIAPSTPQAPAKPHALVGETIEEQKKSEATDANTLLCPADVSAAIGMPATLPATDDKQVEFAESAPGIADQRIADVSAAIGMPATLPAIDGTQVYLDKSAPCMQADLDNSAPGINDPNMTKTDAKTDANQDAEIEREPGPVPIVVTEHHHDVADDKQVDLDKSAPGIADQNMTKTVATQQLDMTKTDVTQDTIVPVVVTEQPKSELNHEIVKPPNTDATQDTFVPVVVTEQPTSESDAKIVKPPAPGKAKASAKGNATKTNPNANNTTNAANKRKVSGDPQGQDQKDTTQQNITALFGSSSTSKKDIRFNARHYSHIRIYTICA